MARTATDALFEQPFAMGSLFAPPFIYGDPKAMAAADAYNRANLKVPPLPYVPPQQAPKTEAEVKRDAIVQAVMERLIQGAGPGNTGLSPAAAAAVAAAVAQQAAPQAEQKNRQQNRQMSVCCRCI